MGNFQLFFPISKYLKNVTVIALVIATMITNHKTLQFTILCQYKNHNVFIRKRKNCKMIIMQMNLMKKCKREFPNVLKLRKSLEQKNPKKKQKEKEKKKEIDQGDLTKYDF